MHAELPASIPLQAVCLRFGEHVLLVIGEAGGAPGEALFGPPVHLRFALRTSAGGDAIVPSRVVDDWGRAVSGADVYNWIESLAYAFPRADAVGLGIDGAAKTFFMKELDLELPPLAYVARSEADFPGRRLDLALEIADFPGPYVVAPADSFPTPLLRAIPAYRLHASLIGAIGAGLVSALLATGRRDLRLAADDLDDVLSL